ncbi:DUF5714 domain-containing protein [Trichloromonas sp.]|uniref:DUF5714 domain-containing protein n=1 Tax=Trichloromonas sp. TaxID=3069249 RepID=UPI003D8183E7
MTSSHSQHCMACGSALLYSDTPIITTCHLCGGSGCSLIRCPQGHYVCDSCHGQSVLALLPLAAERVRGEAPEDILEELFGVPKLPMHGPEHHSVAALALLLAARRQGRPLNAVAVAETIRRAMIIPGGACGYLGSCGAGIALGVAVSMLTGATPLKGGERALANRASAAGLVAAGDGGARCCKRALRNAVRAGREFLQQELGIELPAPAAEIHCRDKARNRECLGSGCPYL